LEKGERHCFDISYESHPSQPFPRLFFTNLPFITPKLSLNHAVADEIGDIKNQPKRIVQAKILGENIIKYMKIIKGKK
jgi:hypothetical protein